MKTKNELEKLFEGKKPFEIAIIIDGATGHRTTLLDELTEVETARLLQIYGPAKPDDLEALRTWRSNVLAVAERTGIKESASWDSFNGWMKNSSKYKKELYKLTLQELKYTHKQLLMVEKRNTESAKNFGTKAFWRKGVQNIERN